MSTTAPTKRQIATNSVPSRQGLVDWASPFFRSSIGGKYLVAVTGLILTIFVIVHMLGNLQVFFGPTAINTYAQTLKSNLVVLWGARAILIIAFVIHIGVALYLNWRSRQARPIGYAHERTVQASFASRHMVITGLLILAFTLYHISDFTLAVVWKAEVSPRDFRDYHELLDPGKRPDVYSMMIYGFRNPINAVIYIVAQVVLFLHLIHGVASMFQTVGLNSPRAQRLIRWIAWIVAIVVCGGNIGIVAGVWTLDRVGILEPSVQKAAAEPGGLPPQPNVPIGPAPVFKKI